MATSSKLKLELLTANQAGAETTVNAALNRLDTMSNIVIVDIKDGAAPTGLDADDAGKAYILGTSPSGGWSTMAQHDIAFWDGAAWQHYDISSATVSVEGLTAYVQDEDKIYYYTGSAWAVLYDPGTAAIETMSGHITSVIVKEYILEEKAQYAYTINSIAMDLGTGTNCTVAIKLRDPNASGGTAVVWPSSATTITQTTTHQELAAASANAVAAGKQVVLVISAITATPADLSFTLKTTRS